MCKNCVRSKDGKRLTNYPDPLDMKGVTIEPMPPMSDEMQEFLNLWHLITDTQTGATEGGDPKIISSSRQLVNS